MKNLQVVEKEFSSVPIIDISALVSGKDDLWQEAASLPDAARSLLLRRSMRLRHSVASQIRQACRESGFFYIIGHGVDENLQQRLEELSRQFLAATTEYIDYSALV